MPLAKKILIGFNIVVVLALGSALFLPNFLYYNIGPYAAYHRLCRDIYDDNVTGVNAELNAGLSPNALGNPSAFDSDDDYPPLCVARESMHWDLVKLLLARGADPNSTSPDTGSLCYQPPRHATDSSLH